MKLIFHKLAAGILLLSTFGAAYGLTVDRVLATVNNEVITLTDYGRYVSKLDPAADRETVADAYLIGLIEERLILQEAVKRGYTASEEEVTQSIEIFLSQNNISREQFEKKLSEEGISMPDYRSLLKENIISLKCIEKEVNSKVIAGSADVSGYYEKNRGQFLESPEKVLVKAIILRLSDNPSLTEITDLKIKSLKIVSQLKQGEPFEKAVHKHADEGLKSRDGVLGEFERGALIPQLDEKIFSMKEGEISDPVWTKEGVYILKQVKRSPAVYTPFEKIREGIYEKVYEQMREARFNEWMKKLWENSSVKIHK